MKLGTITILEINASKGALMTRSNLNTGKRNMAMD